MDLELLSARSTSSASRAYRARQIWRWAAEGADWFEAMTDLPLALRETLADAVPFSTLTLEHEAHARDGTVKALFTHRRRPPGRGGADALPRRAAFAVPLLAVGLPADVHVLRHRRRCGSAAT